MVAFSGPNRDASSAGGNVVPESNTLKNRCERCVGCQGCELLQEARQNIAGYPITQRRKFFE